MEVCVQSVVKRWLSAVLVALCIGAYVYAQGLDLAIRVAGEIISVDKVTGTYTIETSSGPRMTVLPLPGRGGGGLPLDLKAGESVVVQFRRSSAQGRIAGNSRRPGTVDVLSVTPAQFGFCSCSAPSDKGCTGTCVGSGSGSSCRVIAGIIYPNVCGVEQLRDLNP